MEAGSLPSGNDPGGDRGGAARGVHGAGGPGAGAAARRRALPAPDALPHAAEPPLRAAAPAPAAAAARPPRHHPRGLITSDPASAPPAVANRMPVPEAADRQIG